MSFRRYLLGGLKLVLILATPLLAAQDLAEWQSLDHQGAYCELYALFADHSDKPDQTREDNLTIQLLKSKTLIELERWQELEQSLANLTTVGWSSETQQMASAYRLLLAQHAVKAENWSLADSLFISLLKNSTAEFDFRSMIFAEYGFYLLHLQNTVQAESYLLLADSLAPSSSAVTAKVNNALAILYLEQSKLTQAEKCFKKAQDIWESNQWKLSPAYSLLLNDYALYFYVQGDLLKADSFLTRSAELQAISCTTPSLQGYNASARAQILFGLGDYEQAVIQYQMALLFFLKADNHKDAAIVHSKIGEANYFLGQIDIARQHYLYALNMVDSFFSTPVNPIRAQILLGLASIEEYLYNDDAADSLYSLSLQIMEKTSGKNSTSYGTTLSNYARFKEGTGDLTTAINHYHQTEVLDSQLLGTNHPDYKTTLYNLARSYSKVDSVDQALAYYRKANNLQLKLLNNYFESFDVPSRLSYRLEAMGNFDVFFSYACTTENEELFTEIEDINLATKNLALDYAREFQHNLKPDQSPETEALYQEWIQSRKLLAELYFASNDTRKDLDLSIDSLEERVNNLEKMVARQINWPMNKSEMVTTGQVIAKLGNHEAAIDFFNYHVTDEYGRLPDSILYYASIMTGVQESPVLVYLCSQRVLDEILMFSSHYTYNVDVNHLLYQTIWSPLEEYLSDVQKIHVSPEGLLHQVSFAALMPDAALSETLLDRFDFYYYSNLRDFILANKEHKNVSSIYLVGDPDFGQSANQGSEYYSGFFSALPETGKEISNITSLFDNTNIKVNQELGADANETAFYEYLDTFKPSILHLATHGFFFPKDTSIVEPHTLGERIRSSEIPLLRSGFVLSGVNNFWNSDPEISPSADGIVTAQEIANLDLHNTELVVLSACETGRGGIADGEGVFGLQRAFKKAGSPQLLISLWDVPDAATTALMNNFYQLLLIGQTPHNALLEAQRALKLQYPNPYDWAAFVLFQ